MQRIILTLAFTPNAELLDFLQRTTSTTPHVDIGRAIGTLLQDDAAKAQMYENSIHTYDDDKMEATAERMGWSDAETIVAHDVEACRELHQRALAAIMARDVVLRTHIAPETDTLN